jgi:hypothetical protein
MARDAGASTLGDGDPDFLLQPGAAVTAAGDAVKNAHGVAYTPVTVPGHDAPFFIRSSSLAPVAGAVVPATALRVEKKPISWWQWGLLVLGGGAVAYGGYRLYKERKRR